MTLRTTWHSTAQRRHQMSRWLRSVTIAENAMCNRIRICLY